MTLDQLRMLTKIAEEGSVFAAAEALHRTQPTVSIAMKKLEKELGIQILARDQYRASLTDKGQILYAKAKTILQQIDSFEGLAHHLSVGNEPEISIAIEISCPTPLMLKIMRICNEDFSQTQFHFFVESITGAVEKLMLDEADLAITPLLVETDEPLESFSLAQTELLRIAAPSFPLCSKQERISVEDLKAYVQVIVKDSSRNPPDVNFNLLGSGRRWYVNDHYTKKELILAGMGWGMLHRHLVEEELAEGTLRPLKVENHPLTRSFDIVVARKAEKTPGPIATALWQSLQALVTVNELETGGLQHSPL